MRGTVAKRLSRQAVREIPGGSKLMGRNQTKGRWAYYWTGTRRRYQELKREHYRRKQT